MSRRTRIMTALMVFTVTLLTFAPAALAEGNDTLHFGKLEPLAALLQDTPLNKLMPVLVEKLKTGYQANGKTWKVHIDGYNFLPYFKGETKNGPREDVDDQN